MSQVFYFLARRKIQKWWRAFFSLRLDYYVFFFYLITSINWYFHLLLILDCTENWEGSQRQLNCVWKPEDETQEWTSEEGSGLSCKRFSWKIPGRSSWKLRTKTSWTTSTSTSISAPTTNRSSLSQKPTRRDFWSGGTSSTWWSRSKPCLCWRSKYLQ